jgi:hypothetical protein
MSIEADSDRDRAICWLTSAAPPLTKTGMRPSAGSPQQPCLVSVSSDSRGMDILLELTKLTHLSGISQVPSSSTTAMAAMVGLSSSSPRGAEPPPKKACFGALLWVSSRYVCGAATPLRGFCSFCLCSRTQRVIFGWQKSYLGYSDHSSDDYVPGVSPAFDSSGAIGCERG